MSPARVLFIDAYDSFTNNIISLIETELDVEVTTIQIDARIEDFGLFVQQFDAVVAGPGPGHPGNEKDVGLIAKLWQLESSNVRPVLGVCLGFQSLVYSFGGKVGRLLKARHGISTSVTTRGQHLFDGLDCFPSIQYHSLHASLGASDNIWQLSESCPELLPLAWDISSDEGPILMGVCHRSRPFWGIQFHPESICSSKEAKKVVKNWWGLCRKWHEEQAVTRVKATQSRLTIPEDSRSSASSGRSTPSSVSRASSAAATRSSVTSYVTTRESTPIENYLCRTTCLGKLNIPSIVNSLGLAEEEAIIFDSEKRLMPQLGRYSIIAILEPDTTKLTFSTTQHIMKIKSGQNVVSEEAKSVTDVFAYMKSSLNQRKITHGSYEIPFWGGWMGFISYEACLETIDIPAAQHVPRDDICFAFVERSIVIDHVDHVVYVQSIKAQDDKWLEITYSELARMPKAMYLSQLMPEVETRRMPEEQDYKSKIVACQEEIAAGEAYELCLTNQAIFKTIKNNPWQRYQSLRNLNTAPFSSYIRLNSATILSTSPERFMHWTRPSPNHKGEFITTCQFRPIKGTVQKKQTLSDNTIRDVLLEEATEMLSTAKETAENLMIADLIRHDLHGVVGSGNVRVPSLMQVEEYSTVYQLVSVIEGDLSVNIHDPASRTGLDVLASSLPPGSMTGAPKKRSCEILQRVEDESRSIYSGVIGYMCVGGGGDFSVTIRTVFKWDDEDNDQNETWHIGAGGAITILSDIQGEWEEMQGKLASTRRLFETQKHCQS